MTLAKIPYQKVFPLYTTLASSPTTVKTCYPMTLAVIRWLFWKDTTSIGR